MQEPTHILGSGTKIVTDKMKLGPLLLTKQLKKAKRNGDSSFRFTTPKGLRVAVFEDVTTTSDATEYLDASVDLVIGFDVFVQDEVPIMAFSTRSHTNFDCAAFCIAHGGGGHTKSAGFNHKLQPADPNPFYLVKQIVEAYENRA
jgi:nanoRNase/pAp phosphatase (c-di-AMP/oligoRNAs hydrolase)